MEFIDNNSAVAPQEGVTLQDFWLLSLRLLSSFVLIYFQGRQQIVQAWHYVWDKQEWSLVTQMADSGYPAAHILAPLLACLLVVVAAAILLGFLTRILAAVGLMLCVVILLSGLYLSETLNAQALILHSGLLLILMFAGGGRFSLGTLLRRKREAA